MKRRKQKEEEEMEENEGRKSVAREPLKAFAIFQLREKHVWVLGSGH